MLPEDFHLSRYRFDLEAVDPLHLPIYPGRTLRGGFGHAFKKMVCAQADWHACTPCQHGNTCPYGYIFEPTLPADSPVFRSMHEITPPFIIDASQVRQQFYQPGEQLAFEVVLVGRADAYLPYFLLAFQELGRMGLGSPPGRYVVQRISAVHPWQPAEELVYDGVDLRMGGGDLRVRGPDIITQAEVLSTHQVILHFLTPTRIKHRQQFVTVPAFHVLVRTLLRRSSTLAAIHCGTVWETNVHGLIAAAEAVAIREQALDWSVQGRFSGRQQQRLDLSGLVGSITYAGNLEPFRPLLMLGALIHVGKAAVLGHGKYRVENG
jgi:hypothetical protein